MLVAVVFAVAAIAKGRSSDAFREFTRSIRRLGVPVPGTGTPVAAAIIATESAIAVLLTWSAALAAAGVAGPWRTIPGVAGLALAAALLILFSAGIYAGLRRGGSATCQCFGPSATVLGVPHIVRNLLLGGLAATGALLPGGTGETAGMALAACSGVVVALLVIASDDLVQLFRADIAAPSN
ncbi:MauE/DoxX family redox-associated membrane protein [Spirillospora sp. CA-294931]|uniref:MauE/DoxX family redox-associated membrane protein n=1 Tax=Spirillospora sp. CA-294931 TaxID=3240042 RepID=UPI003D8FBA1D